MIDIDKTIVKYDSLMDEHELDKAEQCILDTIVTASSENDSSALMTLYNEIIGHYRERGMFDESISFCRDLLHLMDSINLKGTVPYATSLINVANACRAAGLLKESLAYYEEALRVYNEEFDRGDYSYAPLYNNMALLFQEMGDYESSVDCLMKALGIVELYENCENERAVTMTNLAASLLRCNRYEEAVSYLKSAMKLFNDIEDREGEADYHYGAALSAMAEAMYMAGNLKSAASYYEQALREIEKNTGKSKAYEIVKSNLEAVNARIQSLPDYIPEFENGMDLCRRFYEEYGIPMIREKFPDYEDKIAVGLVGEGSECFGYDDSVSRDHDFGPGFCLWISDSVYDEIGEELQRAYDELPLTYLGVTRINTKQAGKRVGVFRIGDFYEQLIGLKSAPTTENQWLFLDDYRLASATNGEVFRDDLGEFTRIRKELLGYYPDEVRMKKIAREASLIAQTGQYNYMRMYDRKETVTAYIALSEFMKHTMQMVYLLNRTYAPFYKWMHRGMENLMMLKQVRKMLEVLSTTPIGDERIPEMIEAIVALIIAEMKKQSLTSGDNNYLDAHTDMILKALPDRGNENPTIQSHLVDTIVEMEWEAFDKVKNEGGRASCQDDYSTFSIMRKSQYMTWTKEMLESFICDFKEANNNGWNLITEKYGRMEESTAPDKYAEIKDSLPVIPPMKKAIIEEIVSIQVKWMEDFAARYPKAAGNARSVHTSEDTPYNTSYETYLRGELSTYSDMTLDLYGRFVADLLSKDSNLAEMTMENTAKMYGYSGLDDLEKSLK